MTTEDGKYPFVFGSWLGGRYVDRWTAVHLLYGVVAGLIAYIWDISFWVGFITALVIAALWEVYEIVAKVYEPWSNIFTDMLIAAIGFPFAYFFAPLFGDDAFTMLLVLSSIFVVLQIAGWLSWMKRTGRI